MNTSRNLHFASNIPRNILIFDILQSLTIIKYILTLITLTFPLSLLFCNDYPYYLFDKKGNNVSLQYTEKHYTYRLVDESRELRDYLDKRILQVNTVASSKRFQAPYKF